MTEWNGFKIGGLYIDKWDTYHDDGRPLPFGGPGVGTPAPMLVVAIKRLRCVPVEDLLHIDDDTAAAAVTFIHRGQAVTVSIPQTWTGEWGEWGSRWKSLALANGKEIKK